MRRGAASCGIPFEGEEAAAHDGGVDSFTFMPTIQAAVRVENLSKQRIHGIPPFGPPSGFLLLLAVRSSARELSSTRARIDPLWIARQLLLIYRACGCHRLHAPDEPADVQAGS